MLKSVVCTCVVTVFVCGHDKAIIVGPNALEGYLFRIENGSLLLRALAGLDGHCAPIIPSDASAYLRSCLCLLLYCCGAGPWRIPRLGPSGCWLLAAAWLLAQFCTTSSTFVTAPVLGWRPTAREHWRAPPRPTLATTSRLLMAATSCSLGFVFGTTAGALWL